MSSSWMDKGPSGPIHRVNGRVTMRKPDHRIRSTFVCPYRFRFAWWSRRESPSNFGDLCENCKVDNRKKKLGIRF